MVHYFLHNFLKAKHKNFKKQQHIFNMFFSNLHSTTLESIKHKQYLISKQKHSKISLYLIMLPRQLLHTHSTNYTHTCTNWLKGCDNYKLKLIIFLHECRDCIAQSRNTTNFLLITSESTLTKNYEYMYLILHNSLQYYSYAFATEPSLWFWFRGE